MAPIPPKCGVPHARSGRHIVARVFWRVSGREEAYRALVLVWTPPESVRRARMAAVAAQRG